MGRQLLKTGESNCAYLHILGLAGQQEGLDDLIILSNRCSVGGSSELQSREKVLLHIETGVSKSAPSRCAFGSVVQADARGMQDGCTNISKRTRKALQSALTLRIPLSA